MSKSAKQLLHVGCGSKSKAQTTAGFNTDEWDEIRYDIDESVNPDIVGSITDLSELKTGSVDAIFSSHNIEHLFAHEVPIALSEFFRVLTPDGMLVITCPDLQSVAELIVQDRLIEPAYDSPAGPISPLDIVYGHRASIKRGNVYMAHRCGFTKRVLSGVLSNAGFKSIASAARKGPHFDLWALASKSEIDHEALRRKFNEYSGYKKMPSQKS